MLGFFGKGFPQLQQMVLWATPPVLVSLITLALTLPTLLSGCAPAPLQGEEERLAQTARVESQATGDPLATSAAGGDSATSVSHESSDRETTSQQQEKEKTMFTGSRTVELVSSDDFATRVLNASRPVLVDFYADWCPPCRMLAPVLQEVAREVDHVDVVKVNVDNDPRLASQYRVSAIPTLILFKDGQPVERVTGFVPKQELKEMLMQYE